VRIRVSNNIGHYCITNSFYVGNPRLTLSVCHTRIRPDTEGARHGAPETRVSMARADGARTQDRAIYASVACTDGASELDERPSRTLGNFVQFGEGDSSPLNPPPPPPHTHTHAHTPSKRRMGAPAAKFFPSRLL
jgi:hypothetical protein